MDTKGSTRIVQIDSLKCHESPTIGSGGWSHGVGRFKLDFQFWQVAQALEGRVSQSRPRYDHPCFLLICLHVQKILLYT